MAPFATQAICSFRDINHRVCSFNRTIRTNAASGWEKQQAALHEHGHASFEVVSKLPAPSTDRQTLQPTGEHGVERERCVFVWGCPLKYPANGVVQRPAFFVSSGTDWLIELKVTLTPEDCLASPKRPSIAPIPAGSRLVLAACIEVSREIH